MDKTILITLNGHSEQFRLEAAAHDELERYLAGASARLHDDPDQAEILSDLERSVGDRLAALSGGSDRLITEADVNGVLEAIGSVDAGSGAGGTAAAAAAAASPSATGAPKRRLQRIRQGQQLAGVCTGIAAYADLDVNWVRLFFLAATTVTAGVFALVYAALAFFLPVAETRSA